MVTGKWSQDISIVGIKSCAGIAAEDTKSRVLSMTKNYQFDVHSSAL